MSYTVQEEPMITARGLTKSYGDVAVLRGVDLDVEAGSVLALLGANGAGKTTTVRILATLTPAGGGHASVAGHDVRTDRAGARRALAVTGQYAALDALLTGRENLVQLARLRGLGRRAARDRAGELLERFELTAAADRRVATYSGGMRRRVDIAASLVGRPQVLFLDEPTTGLDPRSRRETWAVVRELACTGTTVLLTTQYLEEADVLADRVSLLHGGEVVATGTPAALKARVGGHRLAITPTSAAAAGAIGLALQSLGVAGAEVAPDAVVVPVADPGPAVRRLLDAVDPGRDAVAAFAVHGASLDDVFLRLTATAAATSEEFSRV
jgi:ABC-2 type transport system ATP-binding protein